MTSRVLRDWGYYVDHYRSRDRVLKTLTVLPGRATSLQLHNYRAELWVVQSGTGVVIVGNRALAVHSGCEVSVPTHVPHKIQNVGSDDLVILELQHGEDCREADIVRFVE